METLKRVTKENHSDAQVRRTHYYTMEVGECDGYARSKVGAHIMERDREKLWTHRHSTRSVRQVHAE
jgi:hypothetical protein